MSISNDEIRAIAAEAADQAVAKMLLSLGVDIYDALEQQQDAAFVRKLRVGTQHLGWKAIGALIVVVVGGWATATWLGFRHLVSGS